MSSKVQVFVLLAALASPAAAQMPASDGSPAPASGVMDPTRAEVSREQLQALLQSYQEGAKSPAYSAAYRERTRGQTTMIRDRLQNGDLQVGDKVQLVVEGQAPLTSTFTVDPGRVLVLPGIGAIPLTGVLRSELETHLTKEVGRYVVQPIVHAQSLIRITVLGSVTRPGFYVIPAQALVPDAIMLAGGPTGAVDMNKLKITRSGNTIWDGSTLQKAVVDGWTLDQLSLRAGDEIVVPAPKSGGMVGFLRAGLYAIGPLTILLRALRII